MINENVKRYSLSSQVADKLEEKITKGEYQIGDKIPTETALMEMFNVSRNTIREAIKELTSSGVLDVRQGDGTYVKSDNRFSANMTKKYEEVSYKDVSEARQALEITIAHLASIRRTDKDLTNIKNALDRRNDYNATIKENTVADINFHIAIADATHNQIIIDLYKSIYAFIEKQIMNKNIKTKLDSVSVDNLHFELYKAIENQDSEEAIKCAKKILEL